MISDYQIKNNRYELFAALFILWSNIVNIVLGFSRNFINIGKLDTVVLYCILVVFFFCAFKTFVSRFQGWMIITSLLIVFTILFSSLFSQDSSVNFEVLGKICQSCLPLFIIVCCVRNCEALYYYLVNISVLIPIMGLVLMLFFPFEIDPDGGSYSQSMAYLYMVPTLLQALSVFKKIKIINLLSLLCGLFVILSFGARGPFISIVIFLMICGVRNIVKKNGSFLPVILIGVSVIVVMLYWESIVVLLLDLFISMGLSTRTLLKFVENELFVDDGRNSIVAGCTTYILNHPFFGTLPINERFIVDGFLGESEVLGSYPHNFFLEILMQFGLIPGLVILYFYGKLIFKAFKSAGNQLSKDLLLLFLCAALLPLLVSSSYLQDENFYLLLALLIVYSKGLLHINENVK